ncbi:NACHT, LRR and PYD domains-containing protein 12-like [Cyprinodon tularosa]|uniref:NACHT, LRR and PYD domains-containing protein 12-like n=1 Tax=Cyprinodon tularosa TaxID=77115 RepID=UPI0018E1FE5D|nr:NACHT, LRR and PYD domains-containing protein 12-like [Cyprinodon tularosa]XP_038127345.1 NACHT, LRR and PYD domains-containing protein 12-like [Cyprinodon tularosa]
MVLRPNQKLLLALTQKFASITGFINLLSFHRKGKQIYAVVVRSRVSFLEVDRMDKAEVLARILQSEDTSTVLGGQCPASVIKSRKCVPVTAKAQGGELGFLDEAIRTALTGQTRNVVLVGSEGVGKTTALHKLVADWAKGDCLQNFAHVFHFQFRRMGSIADELCLETLIQKSLHQIPAESAGLVTEKPDAVLFVLDGLDEHKHSLDPSAHSLTSDPTQPVSVSCLLASLLHGSLLKGAAFLVASRPTANLKFLKGTQVEVLGFQKPQRELYFNTFFTEPAAANRALEHMETTLGFYDFCASPRFCWTVCSIYKCLIYSAAKLPETLSQLFIDILVHLIQSLSLTKACSRGLLLALGKMASHCLHDPHACCSKDILDSCGFQQQLTALGSFLKVHDEKEFSFHSQLMQEFVLAVAFFLDASTYEDVEKMLGNHKGCTKLLDFFMSGLSEPVQYRSLEELLGIFSSDQIKGFKSWFKSSSEKKLKDYNKSEHYRCFHLLHQVQNESLVKEILTPPAHPCIFHENLSLADCAALNYVITCLGEREKLSLSRTTISKEIMEVLLPSVRLSHTVILSNCSIHIESIPLLASAVCMGATRELVLSHSNLRDEKAQVLFTGLRRAKLHRLNLNVCELTASCCGDLVSMLTSETSQLQILELMFNPISDQGFMTLCEAMHSPNCRLQELQLGNCDLTEASMEAFAAALCSGESRLRKIDLKDNEIGDRGVEALCKALQQPNGKLQSLGLFDTCLTGVCCSHLMKVLMSEHCSLSELDLSLNDLGQEGALLLCQGVNRPNCPIEILGLTRCKLTQTVFQELGSVLKNGTCQIKSLLLAINKVGDQGVKYILEAVAHPSCLLEELSLEMTTLTDACVEDLCAALRANNTLKLLELRNNSLTDAAAPPIVQVMKEKHNMKELNLKYNDFSEDALLILDECPNIRY